MVRTRLALVGLLCVLLPPAASHSADAASGDLTARLSKSLRSPYLALDRTGAIAMDAATGEVLFSHNATLPLVPASNEKLPVEYLTKARDAARELYLAFADLPRA